MSAVWKQKSEHLFDDHENKRPTFEMLNSIFYDSSVISLFLHWVPQLLDWAPGYMRWWDMSAYEYRFNAITYEG